MRDIDEIRRVNLRRIEDDAGGLAAAADLVGMSPAQFANLRQGAKDSKTGKPRGMRKATARRIEIAAGKPVGWLDIDHGLLTPESVAERELALLRDFRQLVEADKVSIERLAYSLARSPASLPSPPGRISRKDRDPK